MDFLKHAFAFGSSLLDVGFDFVDARTPLSWLTSIIQHRKHVWPRWRFWRQTKNITRLLTIYLIDPWILTIHQKWVRTSISLVFLPGFFAGASIIMTKKLWTIVERCHPIRCSHSVLYNIAIWPPIKGIDINNSKDKSGGVWSINDSSTDWYWVYDRI